MDQEQKPLEPPAQPAQTPQTNLTSQSRLHRLRSWYASHKKWTIPGTVLAVLLLLGIVPWSRYQAAGLVMKKDFSIKVLDSKSGSPVSGANVSVGSASAQTDGNGNARIHLNVGNHSVLITKKYYKDERVGLLVPILSQKSVPEFKAEATGRQVKVKTMDLVNKQALPGVDISVLDVKAQTDKSGEALLVLPAGSSTQKVTLKLNGYNDSEADIKISDTEIQENDLSLTPAGKIYFLSKRSGKIDLVKTNLDGTEREVVLAGTGKEDPGETVLLASRDWKHLAFLSRRDSKLPKLYHIETTTDKVSTIDEGNIQITLVGWAGDRFVYSIYKNNFKDWEPKREALKSYNASTKQLLTLDQTKAEGQASSAGFESYASSFAIVGETILFTKNWNFYVDDFAYYYYDEVTGEEYYDNSAYDDAVSKLSKNKPSGIYAIRSDGSAFRNLKSINSANTGYISLITYRPEEVYFNYYDYNAEKDSYYKYVSGQLSEDSKLREEFEEYNRSGEVITYLLSPSDNESFWAENRDGKNTLFIGDDNGAAGKEIADSSKYNPYGWFGDKYLLASKDESELYILPKEGIKKDEEAVKISDYHKPVYSYYGYGGGYGGI